MTKITFYELYTVRYNYKNNDDTKNIGDIELIGRYSLSYRGQNELSEYDEQPIMPERIVFCSVNDLRSALNEISRNFPDVQLIRDHQNN